MQFSLKADCTHLAKAQIACLPVCSISIGLTLYAYLHLYLGIVPLVIVLLVLDIKNQWAVVRVVWEGPNTAIYNLW